MEDGQPIDDIQFNAAKTGPAFSKPPDTGILVRFLQMRETLAMKQNAFILMILLTAIAANSACWSPKEVSATRSSRPSSDSPSASPSTPSPNKSNSSTENKNPDPAKPKNPETPAKTGGFKANLPANFQMPTDDTGLKLLSEYGSLCVAGGGVTAPDRIAFRDQSEASAFQSGLQKSSDNIGGFNVELQSAAMSALKKSISEARQVGKDITPRAADSAKRTYDETVKLWESRVTPALKHWVSKGRLQQTEADRIRSLPPSEQVSEILKLESQGIYFSKDFSKSILYSAAAPGASQHIFMLAFDVEQFADRNIREILARNGWFQTVQSDMPHFTYLGVAESELPRKGLKPVEVGGQKFWVPKL
jgi:hypothetical protein